MLSCKVPTEGFITSFHPIPTATAHRTRPPGLAALWVWLGPQLPAEHQYSQLEMVHPKKDPASTGYLHTAVCHRHGVICQGITGYFTVVGAGRWGEDIARTHVVGVNGIIPLEGPRDKQTRTQLSARLGLEHST